MDVRFVGEDRDYEVVFFAWRAQSEKIDAVSAWSGGNAAGRGEKGWWNVPRFLRLPPEE